MTLGGAGVGAAVVGLIELITGTDDALAYAVVTVVGAVVAGLVTLMYFRAKARRAPGS